MNRKLVEIPGEPIPPESLSVAKARNLYSFLASGIYPYASAHRLLRKSDGTEGVIADLSIEVGQEPIHDVRPLEPVALLFGPTDETYPDVLSLRPDFPQVPHLQLRDEEVPKGLCLYEEPYPAVKLTWTPAKFLERIRVWFRDTARGALHREDQPLEPILLAGRRHLVIPADLFARGGDDAPEKLWVLPRAFSPEGEFFVARRIGQASPPEQRQALAYLATTFQCQPQTHGVIRKLPRNLFELHNLMLVAGVDLLAVLRVRMLTWNREDAPLDARLTLITFFPKTRAAGKSPEVSDIWAFMTIDTIRQIGSRLGFWQALPDGHVAALIGQDIDSAKAADVAVFVLNPSFALNRYHAALMNGYAPSAIRIVGIGLGALGSQVVPKLIRGGFGSWVFIDNDHLLSHNVARHELTQSAVGYPKAATMQAFGNDIIEDAAVTEAIVADILAPRDKREQIETAIQNAETVLDLSASVPVGRHLAALSVGPRRVSAFLNPDGNDLVILAEDAQRRTTLDCVEMQYYRQLISRPELAGHFAQQNIGRIRYAHTCRDLTSNIPGDLVSLHAAIAANAFRGVVEDPNPTISIWRAAPDRSVRFIHTPPERSQESALNEWRLRTDQGLLSKLFLLRSDRLPNETGGVFVGAFDLERKIVYVVDLLPSPPDSKEWPMLYIRGCSGLAERLEEIDKATAGMLQYVGEWHSHPDGCSTNPSSDDRKVFSWLREHMQIDGLPPVMAIAGQGSNIRWFVEGID